MKVINTNNNETTMQTEENVLQANGTYTPVEVNIIHDKSAKEMLERIGYDCFDDRESEEKPLSILYKQPERGLGEHVPYVNFNLVDKKWDTNIVDVHKLPVQAAIDKQIEELGLDNG